MKTKITFRIVLSLVFLTYSILPIIAQSSQNGTVKGIITKNKTGLPYSKVDVYVKIGDKIIAETVSDDNGRYELTLPIGFHNLYASSIYSTKVNTIEVQPGPTMERDFVLPRSGEDPTWEKSEPYPELSGQWTAVSYTKWGQTTSLNDQIAIYFSFSDNELPGQIGWTDGCRRCGNLTYTHYNLSNLYFRHLGNGNLEVNKEATVYCTMSDCPDKNVEIGAFIHNMKGKTTKSVVSENGKTLELSLGNEKLVFQKIGGNKPKLGK